MRRGGENEDEKVEKGRENKDEKGWGIKGGRVRGTKGRGYFEHIFIDKLNSKQFF